MKKRGLVSIFIIGLLLGACGSKNETPSETGTTTSQISQSQTSSEVGDSDSSNASSEVQSTVTETTETSSDVSETKETDTSTSGSTSDETTSESGTSANIDPWSELVELYPEVAFPKEVPHTDGNVVNIAVAESGQQLSVLYFDMDKPLIVNKKELNYETPIAQYTKDTFDSSQQAKEAVNLRVDMQGKKVDLGYGITGFQQGAAGSSYIAWQEGNWNLLVRASNIEEQDPVPTAKEVVEYLESAMLPAPEAIGQITIDLVMDSYRGNEVTWQVDNVVYTTRHIEPLGALKMAVSTIE